jgi:hypothetical protein
MLQERREGRVVSRHLSQETIMEHAKPFPTTIRASVSPDTINRVGRLFNNTLIDVLHELLQNARRAGASRIDMTLRHGAAPILAIADDGIGIADPASVITLGRSDWGGRIADIEDPAGMGMFSLAGHDATIVSRHASIRHAWTLSIPADAWDGSRDLAVDVADRAVGTTIEIVMPADWLADLDRAVAKVALYYPRPVTLNGTACNRQDWLADALYTTDWNGSTIGVFTGLNRYPAPSLNFHGLTVACKLPSVAELDGGSYFSAHVDIHDTPALQLVLPSRKEAIENAALDDLREAVERAIYAAIATRPRHTLPFERWCRARALGIELPEAEADLQGWFPSTADPTMSTSYAKRLPAAEAIIVEATGPDTDQCLARALQASPLRERLVAACPAYEGYRWYDRIPRLANIRFDVVHDGGAFTIDDALTEPMLADHLRATEITFRADLRDGDQLISISEDIDVAFVSDDVSWAGLEAVRIVYRDTLPPGDLADLLDAAYFCPFEDADCDSWDTQHRAFETEARECAVTLLRGIDEAICDQFRCLLRDNRWLVPKGVTLQLSVGGDSIEVQLTREAIVSA